MAGVETWKAIAERVDQLMDYRGGRFRPSSSSCV
jgi:hypothetical protein